MLEFKNVSYVASNADGEKEIIKNVSFEIDQKFTCLTGPNGGGKSTLAKLIMGIIKPTEGRIMFEGRDITQ